MSWDADLHCDSCGHSIGEWNYTHNTNRMIEQALLGHGVTGTAAPFWAGDGVMGRYSWWRLLEGRSAPDGAALLTAIVVGLESDPDGFRAMNPDNGWGSYDGVLKVLREMRDASTTETPATWSVGG